MPKKIATIPYLSKSRNAEHYELQERFLATITPEFAAQFKIGKYRANYQAMFDKEDKAFLQNQAWADTKEIDEKDVIRDKRFRHLDLTLQSKLLSLIPAEVEAAEQIAFIMSPYSGAPSKPFAENTAMVNDLVKKLQSPQYAPCMETLGLTAAVAALKTANDDFEELYSHRASDKLQRLLSDKMKAIRPEVDAAFFKLAEAIDALYLVNESIEYDEAKTAALGKVIDDVNAQIIQFTETLFRRGVRKKVKSDSGKPDNVNPPEEGGESSDRPEID